MKPGGMRLLMRSFRNMSGRALIRQVILSTRLLSHLCIPDTLFVQLHQANTNRQGRPGPTTTLQEGADSWLTAGDQRSKLLLR